MSRLIRHLKDLYVFDLDMTLVNTIFETGIHPSIVNTIQELGGIVPPIEVIRSWWYANPDDWDAFVREHFKLDADVFWPAFRHHDTPEFRLQFTQPFPGVIEALQHLQSDPRIKLAVITAAKQNIMDAEVALLKGVHFSECLSLNGHSRFRDKPHPDGLLHIMETLGIGPERTVYDGDSLSDAKFANNTEVDFIHFNERQAKLDLPAPPLAIYDQWGQFYDLEAQVA